MGKEEGNLIHSWQMNSSYQKAVNQIQEVSLMADFRYSLAGKKDADVLAEASESYTVGNIFRDGGARLIAAKLNS